MESLTSNMLTNMETTQCFNTCKKQVLSKLEIDEVKGRQDIRSVGDIILSLEIEWDSWYAGCQSTWTETEDHG